MRIFDHPISVLRERTPRELALLSIGAGYCVYELFFTQTVPLNVVMYALATITFAFRFFPARALGVGVAIGALAQRLPDLRVSWNELGSPHTWAAIAVIVLLASRDLEERFDRAPSPIRFVPNAWAALPAADMRVLRSCVYALGALAALLVYVWGPTIWFTPAMPDVLWMVGTIAAIASTILLLVAGRAPALLLVPIVCVPIGAVLGTEVALAERSMVDPSVAVGHGFAWLPQYVLPAVLFAVIATLLALPHSFRLVRALAGHNANG
jgi:hypothetical protein